MSRDDSEKNREDHQAERAAQAELASANSAFHAALAAGDLATAARVAGSLRIRRPTAPLGWILGSIEALLRDDKPAALAFIDEPLRAVPSHVPSLLQKAEVLLALGRREDALTVAERASEHSQGDSAALDAIGQFLVHAAAYSQALPIYDRALTLAAEDPDLLGKRAVIHRFLGNIDRAIDDTERLLQRVTHDAEALKSLAELQRQTPRSNLIERLKIALTAWPEESREAAALHFALAKTHEDLGDPDASWHHLEHANRIERRRVQYDPAIDRAVVDRIVAGFSRAGEDAAEGTGERPIFIIGLPRTGTTLVERIIGNHPQVHSAGELSALSEAIGAVVTSRHGPVRDWLTFASALEGLDPAAVAREYLARARARRGTRQRFSDKQPTNFMHVGTIARAFPHGHVVHVTRHPLAACHAIYKTRFGGTYPFAYDLCEIAHFYVGYQRLMAHWRALYPNRILDVSYEEVVTDLKGSVRRLLAYLELPFDAQCLDFHLNPNSTATASAVQVRQPLYDTSLELWRQFAKQLEPARRILEEAGIDCH